MEQTVEVTLDEVGRIRLPEWLRARLGLRIGSRLVVEGTDEGGAVLRTEAKSGGVVEDGGLLYFDAEPMEDLALFVARERERRDDDLLRRSGL